jgi:NADH-quinone oxidoreductase subunit K
MTVGLEHYLIVSAILFAAGLFGAIARRNLLIILLSIELMLNAANLALVAFSRFKGSPDGQVMVFFTITIAAVEVAIGLALVVSIYRRFKAISSEDLTTMKL